MLFAVVLAGCPRNGIDPPVAEEVPSTTVPSTPPPPSSTAPEATVSCDRRVDGFVEWSRQLEQDGDTTWSREGFELTDADEPANGYPRSSPPLPLLEVTPNLLHLNGHPAGATKRLGAAASLRKELGDWRTRQISSGEEPPSSLVLRIHVDVPWSSVVALVDALAKAKVDTLAIPFRGKSEVEAPLGESEWAEHMKRISKPRDPRGPGVVLPSLEEIEAGPKPFPECPGVLDEIGRRLDEAGSLSPKEKRQLMTSTIAERFRACKCQASLDDARAYLWSQAGRWWAPPVWTLYMPIAAAGSGAGAAEVTLPAATPWREAARALLEKRDAERVVLKVAP